MAKTLRTNPGDPPDLAGMDERALDIGFRAMLQVTLDYLHGNGS